MPLWGTGKSGFSARTQKSHWLFRLLCVPILFYGLYMIFTHFLPGTRIIKSDTMLPTLPDNSRVLVIPYIFRVKDGLKHPPERGDVILLKPPYASQFPWYITVLDKFVRFFTFQKISSMPDSTTGQQEIFKRVIGIPGDEVRIRNFIAQIKPSDSSIFLDEFKQSDKEYDLTIDPLPLGWNDSLPLSGNMEEIVLQDNEFFVLSDNRSGTGDSRYWGPIKESAIHGRAVLIYWPFSEFGWVH